MAKQTVKYSGLHVYVSPKLKVLRNRVVRIADLNTAHTKSDEIEPTSENKTGTALVKTEVGKFEENIVAAGDDKTLVTSSNTHDQAIEIKMERMKTFIKTTNKPETSKITGPKESVVFKNVAESAKIQRKPSSSLKKHIIDDSEAADAKIAKVGERKVKSIALEQKKTFIHKEKQVDKKTFSIRSAKTVTLQSGTTVKNKNVVIRALTAKIDAGACDDQIMEADRKNVKVQKGQTKANLVSSASSDMEDMWKPKDWEQVWENILKMRKLYRAPVDSMGSEQCADRFVEPKVQRFQTLVSLMLSSQTKDEVTYAATQRLIELGLTVVNILQTPDDQLEKLIYPVGFYKSKVKFLKKTCQILKDRYDCDIPSNLEDLCKLPGVGPKMANLAMTVGWGKTVGIAVDTHVHRICNRLGWVPKPTKDPERTRIGLQEWLPKDLWADVSLQLVGFGQTICRPVKPSCSECLAAKLCPTGRLETK